MDDEDIVRNVAGKMLEFLGYRATLARDGREALDLYRTRLEAGNPFSAVILDMVVPGGLDGSATLAELLRMDPGVKAIFSSGYGETAPDGSALKGHAGLVAKPYELKTLAGVLEKILASAK